VVSVTTKDIQQCFQTTGSIVSVAAAQHYSSFSARLRVSMEIDDHQDEHTFDKQQWTCAGWAGEQQAHRARHMSLARVAALGTGRSWI
jgi:hypothetical protein